MPARATARNAPLLVAIAITVAPTASAQHNNVRVSTVGANRPEEVSIAVDPLDPRHLAAGANLSFRYYSLDAGLTWSQGTLTSSMGVWGDPVVVYDAHGNLYYVHLSNPVAGSWLDRIVVQRSTDAGATYGDGVGVGLDPPRDQDKAGLAFDVTGSPFTDRLYLAWTEFDAYGSSFPADSSRVLLSSSSDFGIGWTAPVRVNDAAGNCLDGDDTVEGAIPAVGPQGQVYLAWAGAGQIHFDRSLDGGTSWGQDVVVAAQPGGWDFDVSGLQRCNGLPTTLCDVSGSPYRGFIYVVWSDQRAGVNDTDVFLSRSTDGGRTWGAPVRVNDDLTQRHQFFPAAAVDPSSGILYVVYYDRRATSGDATDVYLARSVDGGSTFHSVEVSDSSFTPASTVFFGDYVGITAWSRVVHPIWMRMDGTTLSVWTVRLEEDIALSAPSTPRPAALVPPQARPNPLSLATQLRYSLPARGRVVLRVLDVQGREAARPVDGVQGAGEHRATWDARRVPAGLYFCEFSAAGMTATSKLIVVR